MSLVGLDGPISQCAQVLHCPRPRWFSYAHFSETLGGLSTIRALDDVPRFLASNLSKVDTSIQAW